jgi:Uma2 family endonuclease
LPRAGIAEYWLVDLTRRAIDVFRNPAGDSHHETTTHHAGDRLALESRRKSLCSSICFFR